MVPAKDLLQQLEDPRFRMADGLSGFSDNRITQTLAQKGMIISSVPVPEDGKGQPIPDDGKGHRSVDLSLGGLNENAIIVIGGGKPADPADTTASLGFFGKLYRMEKTVEKQLQLHEQLDLGALRTPAPKQVPLPNGNSLSPDQGVRTVPDARASAPLDISDGMRNPALYNALHTSPQTVAEMEKMVDVLLAEVGSWKATCMNVFGQNPPLVAVVWLRTIDDWLSPLKHACKLYPSNSAPNQFLLAGLDEGRQRIQDGPLGGSLFPQYQ